MAKPGSLVKENVSTSGNIRKEPVQAMIGPIANPLARGLKPAFGVVHYCGGLAFRFPVVSESPGLMEGLMDHFVRLDQLPTDLQFPNDLE